jgi:hypothetical protein
MLKVADFGESRLLRTKDVVPRRANFFPSADLTLQMTTNIGSACWAVRLLELWSSSEGIPLTVGVNWSRPPRCSKTN